MSFHKTELHEVDRCKVCGGSGGKHVRFAQIQDGPTVPLGDCEDCDGDGWNFSDPEKPSEFKGTYEQCTAWARTEALKPTASPPVLVGLA